MAAAPTGIGAGPLDVIASWLSSNIGPRVVAYAAGIKRAELMDLAAGGEASAEVETRLRNLFAVCSYLAVADGPGTAHDFLLEPNPALGFRTPAELLHDGAPPEQIWMAAVPTF